MEDDENEKYFYMLPWFPVKEPMDEKVRILWIILNPLFNFLIQKEKSSQAGFTTKQTKGVLIWRLWDWLYNEWMVCIKRIVFNMRIYKNFLW